MRSKTLSAIVLSGLALAFAIPAVAEPQHFQGTILVSNPTADALPGVTEGAYYNAGYRANGIDGWILDLNPGLSTFTLVGDGGVLAECDLDIWFYDHRGRLLPGHANVGDSCDEKGSVPRDAKVAVISLWYGFNVEFTFDAT